MASARIGAGSSGGGHAGLFGSPRVFEFPVKNLRHPKAQWVPGTLRIEISPAAAAATTTATTSPSSPILTWRPDNGSAAAGSDSIRLSVAFSEIQKHVVSSAKMKRPAMKLMVDKDKVPNPQSFVFEFTSVEERDNCSREISKLLANTKDSAQPTAEPKASEAGAGATENLIKLRTACLIKDKDLLKLHQDLVGKGLLSEEEFWESRKAVLERELISQSEGGEKSIDQILSLPGSKRGLPSELLSKLEGAFSDSGGNVTVSLKMSTDDISQIFAERPKVRRAFLKLVPEKMSEKDFWTKFVRAEYFMRQRQIMKKQARRLGIRHDEREKEAEEEEIRRDMKLIDSSGTSAEPATNLDIDGEKIRTLDPTLNLVSTDGDELNDCYGLRHDSSSEKRHQIEREVEAAQLKDLDPLDAVIETGGTHELARSLNRHSEVVLEGRASFADSAAELATAIERRTQQPVGSSSSMAAKRQRVEELLAVDDLSDQKAVKFARLNVQNTLDYFSKSSDQNLITLSDQDIKVILGEGIPARHADEVVSGETANSVMKDIMDKIRNQTELFTVVDTQGNLIDAVPDSLKETIKMDAAKAHELVGHLWKCIPVTSYQHIEKGDRHVTAITRVLEELKAKRNSGSDATGATGILYSRLAQPIFRTMESALSSFSMSKTDFQNQQQLSRPSSAMS